MRGGTRPDWWDGKRRYMVSRVEQPREVEGLGHAWAKQIAV